jgi:signal transduction histidine kinase
MDQQSKQPHREQTDESLRTEREKADTAAEKKHQSLEDEADEVVRIARERADQVVRTARDSVDRERPESAAADAAFERERNREDVVLARERSTADAVLDVERSSRKRYLAEFLAVEREATDQDLMEERADADTVIATRDEFLATVSHDLRSLLGGLSLNAQLLVEQASDNPLGAMMLKQASSSQRLLARMNRLVNDLLDMVSLDAGQLGLVREQVDVRSILQDTLEAFEPIARAKRVALSFDLEEPHLLARLDSDRIVQVLANLVSNAIKFTPADGLVSIRIRGEEGEVRFSVSDTGIGIAEDDLATVFDRFRQVSKDRRGLGLGLYISKGVVEAHGGKMWAESRPGSGSTFHFAVPRG